MRGAPATRLSSAFGMLETVLGSAIRCVFPEIRETEGGLQGGRPACSRISNCSFWTSFHSSVAGLRKVDTDHLQIASWPRMALTLLLRSGGLSPVPFVVCEAPRLVLGRAGGCDLQLPDPSVGRRHASLRQRGSEYVLVDEGSENGTFVGRERLASYTPHRVRTGDLIRLGRVWIEVASAPHRKGQSFSARELARKLVSGSLSCANLPCELTLSVSAGPTPAKELALVEPDVAYFVGRSRTASLTIKDEGLPTRAFEVQRKGEQVRIKSLDAEFPLTLGGVELATGRTSRWKPECSLELQGYQFQFDDPVARCLAEIEGSETEPLPSSENVEPPANCSLPDVATPSGEILSAEGSTPTASEKSEDPAPRKRIRRRWAQNAGSERWTVADSFVFSMALCVLGVSLWAIHWVVHFDPV